jgi:methylthioribose-1-phosphate isomerase
MENNQTLKAIDYQRGSLSILDQLKLPDQTIYIPINTVDDAWKAIHTMSIRGINKRKSITKMMSSKLLFRCSSNCCMWSIEYCC